MQRIDLSPSSHPGPLHRLRHAVASARALHQRERSRVRAEIARIPGLMVLLMKPRNGARWSTDERAQVYRQLRGLGVLSLYLGTMFFPGTTITLPLLAWWLDRRRERRVAIAGTANTNTTPPTRRA